MFTAFETDGQFWRGNIHGHSDLSDGAIPPAQVCRRYRAAGYDFISLTDHFLEEYGFPIADTRPFRGEGFTTIPGAELHAMGNSRGELWHLLAVGLPEDFAPTGPAEDAVALARRAVAAGAFVAIAHPQWSQLTLADAISMDAAHAIEIHNHTSGVNADRAGGATLYDQVLSEGRMPGCIAVDDSHWKSDDAFGGWVMVKAQENTPDALVAALRAGAYYASEGPELHDLRVDGDDLLVRCSPIATAILLGPGSRASAVHAIGATELRLPLARFRGGWARLVIRDAAGRRAWSSAAKF